MKRMPKAVSLALLGLVAAAVACGADRLTVATLNCEFLTRPRVHIKFGERFELPESKRALWDQPGYRDRKFAEAAEHVARLIKQIDADIIGLQEVGDERDVRELREAVREAGLDYPYCVVGRGVEPPTYQNVAIFSRYKLSDPIAPIPGREAYDTELDDIDSEQWARVNKGLRVTADVDGRSIYVYVLHLKSERGGHESDARRIAQASIVRRHYLPLLEAGRDVIVLGDLNDSRNQPAIRRIRGRDDIGPDLVQTGLAKYFDRDKLDTRWTYEYMGVRNQIDHVLLSTSFIDKCNRIHARTLQHNDPQASDHLPFIVELEFRD